METMILWLVITTNAGGEFEPVPAGRITAFCPTIAAMLNASEDLPPAIAAQHDELGRIYRARRWLGISRFRFYCEPVED